MNAIDPTIASTFRVLPSGGNTTVSARLPLGRNALIALVVLLLHVGLIWALQTGKIMQPDEIVVPAVMIVELAPAPAPEPASAATTKPQPVAPTPPAAPAKRTVEKAAPSTKKQPKLGPQPMSVPDLQPAPQAPTAASAAQARPDLSTAGMATDNPSALAAPAALTGVTGVTSALPAGPALQLPSSNADYLQNAPPPYPALSRRMNEQGKTVVKVLIGADGMPQKVELLRSSGFERLDQAALATVMRWRYVPGKRSGSAEAMWFDVPIDWELRN